MKGGEITDSTNVYRYALWREWSLENPKLVFVLLNPSQATASLDDPTLRRCIAFAKNWGYGSLEVVNLFAIRSPKPQHLQSAADPIGPECDRYLLSAVARAKQIVIGWGNWGQLYQRDRAVLELIASYAPLYCLGKNQTGQPCHPLYLRKDVKPFPFC